MVSNPFVQRGDLGTTLRYQKLSMPSKKSFEPAGSRFLNMVPGQILARTLPLGVKISVVLKGWNKLGSTRPDSSGLWWYFTAGTMLTFNIMRNTAKAMHFTMKDTFFWYFPSFGAYAPNTMTKMAGIMALESWRKAETIAFFQMSVLVIVQVKLLS